MPEAMRPSRLLAFKRSRAASTFGRSTGTEQTYAQQRVRMEGWRQRRGNSIEDHSTFKGNYKTDLTLTGLLMEGLGSTCDGRDWPSSEPARWQHRSHSRWRFATLRRRVPVDRR